MTGSESEQLTAQILPYRSEFEIRGGTVATKDTADKLPEELYVKLNKAASSLGPWRKGPFSIFGLNIQANWKSDLKWQRILPFLDLKNAVKIADVGCNNGYFLWRMYNECCSIGNQDVQITGLDPVESFYRQFQLIHACIDAPVQMICKPYNYLSESVFRPDRILCMGLLYHLKNPLELLSVIHSSLETKGLLYLETITVELNGSSTLLFPAGPFAGIRGVWFVPEVDAVINMLKRTNFRKIEHLKSWEFEDEMQPVHGMPVLSDYLDHDKNLTTEGYPVPVRSLFRAVR